jgi:hypothetical protein
MIDLVRNRLGLDSVDRFLNLEFGLDPLLSRQSAPRPPSSTVTFGEDPKTVAALIEEGAPD